MLEYETLILEDDCTIVESISLCLETAEPKILIENTEKGKIALEKVKTSNYDLIIVDLGLPDIDGIDVIKELRTFSKTPVIVISARNDPRSITRAYSVGADDYIIKPFDYHQLTLSLNMVKNN
jgi:DNA-binding response OmpR family regulator